MNPIDFPEAVKTLGPPEGMADCGSLRVWTDGERTISCWMPSEEERALLASGAPVWLWIFASGGTQPPVSVEVRSPFEPRGLTGRRP